MERVTLEDKSECMMHQWWRRGSRSEMHLYLLDLIMEGLDLWWGEHLGEHLSEVKGYEISDLFCCVSAIWSVLKSICWWCMFVLKRMERVQFENMMKCGLQVVFYWSCWIQCENWWNVVQGGAEGCSLQSGGCSSLPGEAGKRDQGVVAPFQERLVNESGGWSSLPGEAGKRAQVGACVLVKSAPAHML